MFVIFLCLCGVSLARPTDQEDIYNYSDNEDYQRDGEDDDYDQNYNSPDQDGEGDVPLNNDDKPDFVSSGQTINVDVGESAQLSCQVNDLGGNQMMWLKSPGLKGAEDILYIGTIENTKSPRRSLATIENNQGTILTISQANQEDAGTYICKIADTSYDQQLEFHVSVGAGNLPSNLPSKDGAGDVKGGSMAVKASVSLLTVVVAVMML